jgi:hypothetical protein
MKILSHHSRCPARDSKSAPHKYGSGELPLSQLPQSQVRWFRKVTTSENHKKPTERQTRRYKQLTVSSDRTAPSLDIHTVTIRCLNEEHSLKR